MNDINLIKLGLTSVFLQKKFSLTLYDLKLNINWKKSKKIQKNFDCSVMENTIMVFKKGMGRNVQNARR